MPAASAFTPVVPTGNPTTGFTVAIPAGAVAGVILEISVTSRDSINPALGPTISDNDTGGNAWAIVKQSADGKATTWWKRATGGTAGKTITIAAALGSCSGVLQGFSGCAASGTPQTNVAEESNASGDETHAGITPSQADSMVRAAVYNYGNDNSVTSLSFATLGATTMTEKLSTGGSDCACASGYKLQAGAAAATGNLTWSQTNGATYSHVWALKPLEEHSGSATLTSGGGITPEAATQRGAAPTLTSGGGITPTSSTQRGVAPSLASGGGIALAAVTQRAAVPSLTSGGGLAPVAVTQRSGIPTLAGGGFITSAGAAEEDGPEEHSGSATLTSGGGIAPTSSSQRGAVPSVVSGGSIASTAAAQRAATPSLASGGGLTPIAATQRSWIPILVGGGLITVQGLAEDGEEHFGSATLTNGGGISSSQTSGRASAAFLVSGGSAEVAARNGRFGTAELRSGGAIGAAGFNSTPIEYRALMVQLPSLPRVLASPEGPIATPDSGSGYGPPLVGD